MNFSKYKKNLTLVDVDGVTFVKSYSTLVAKIEGDKLIQLDYWSATTQKHINYVASELRLQLVK